MRAIYHVTTKEGAKGLIKDQKFFDENSCGWLTLEEAIGWANIEKYYKKQKLFIVKVVVKRYKQDRRFCFAVIRNKDISKIILMKTVDF